MWELLQKLENLWWKPYWKSIAELTETEKNIRLLTSLSSWLWQFVCENKLVEHWVYTRAKWQRRKKYDNYWNKNISVDKPEYRLIESSLKDESELEQFLLDNIKIDG